MIINKELLESKSACKEGVKLFCEMFPDGLDLSLWAREKQLEIIKTELRKYIGWAYYNNIIPLWGMSGADLSGADLSGADIDRDPKIDGWKYENRQLWRI